ncbi:MAG: hypothetical protein SOW60_06375, partial [Bacteroidaceae bacterium]|nr:hypothetical protein [Bacteroidaceae bacterium]
MKRIAFLTGTMLLAGYGIIHAASSTEGVSANTPLYAVSDTADGSAARLTGLQNEHLECPIGIDNPSPRLSWQMEDDRQGAKQLSYRI